MGLSKTEYFTDKQNEIAELFKAVGHPARVAILQHILKTRGCICNDIVNELPLAQPTVSQHLKELKNAGIIKGTISGKSICYCLNTDKWNLIKVFVADFFNPAYASCCQAGDECTSKQ